MQPRATLVLGLAFSLAAGCADKHDRTAATPTPGGPAAPTLFGVAPPSGPTPGGTTITVTGTGFQSGATLTVGGAVAPNFGFISSTTVTAVTPSGAMGPAAVVLTNPDGQSATLPNGFTYVGAAPTLTAIAPVSGSGWGGETVTLSGSGFVAGATVTFGGAAATSVAVVNGGSITCVTPPGPNYTVSVTVTNPDTQSATLTNGFAFSWQPTITNWSPNTGPSGGGTLVTLTGTNFRPGMGVQFGGNTAQVVNVLSLTQITCITPPYPAGTTGSGVYDPNGNGIWYSNVFTYTSGAGAPPPTLASITPALGPPGGGTAVTIVGTDLVSGTTVTIGGAALASASLTPTTQVAGQTPAGTRGFAAVRASVPDGRWATMLQGFRYAPAPAVSAISPTGGPDNGSTPVTISGTDFEEGATVMIGGTAATGVVVRDATTCLALAPAGSAGAANVVVTNPTGLSGTLTGGYTYGSSASLPAVSSVNANGGPACGGTVVTLTGGTWQSGAAVRFGGEPATAVTVSSGTQIVVTTPRAPAAPGALCDVTVANPGGDAGTLTGAFTYTPYVVEAVSGAATECDTAVDGSGNLHVVFSAPGTGGADDVYHVRSTDGGQTWSSATNLSSSSVPSTRPRCAARGSGLAVVWNEFGSTAIAVQGAMSSDSGANFGGAVSLVSTGSVTPDPVVAWNGSGQVVLAACVSGGSGPPPQQTARVHLHVWAFTPSGALGTPVVVGGGDQIVWRPAVAADGQTVVVAWQTTPVYPHTIGFAPSFVAASSTDGAGSFGSAQLLRAMTGWSETGSDPAVAVRGATAVVAWTVTETLPLPQSGSQITHYTQSAARANGATVFAAPIAVATGGERPSVCVDAAGTVELAFDAGGSARDVLSVRSTDGGVSYGAAYNWANNLGASSPSRLAAGPSGRVFRVWLDDTGSAGTANVLGY